MKANTNKKNKSASRKLVPAVAMLTTSAVMLSSATYAWFTLNKEVEVTGLTMQATVSNSLEISLGDFGENEAIGTISAPDKDDKSWKRSIAVGSYYEKLGLLLPASSANGKDLFYVDNSKVYAGGRAVETDADVYAVADTNQTSKSVRATYSSEGAVTVNKDAEGYYVDIPMWIRTANISDNENGTPVSCTVTITDNNDSPITGSDLSKAVRVAILNTGNASNTTGHDEIGELTNSATSATANGTTIFGLTNTTYSGTNVVSASGTYALTTAPTVNTPTESNNFITHDVFTIPNATKDNYAGVSFIARVWIEGESTYCNDATANQDWNIDFHFEILGGNPASGGEGGGT